MVKRLLALFVAMLFAVAAFAAVDVNTADQAALESVKGLGPAFAERIITEREANGLFKNYADLAERIKGLGDKKVEQLKEAGLTVSSADEAKAKAKAKKGD